MSSCTEAPSAADTPDVTMSLKTSAEPQRNIPQLVRTLYMGSPDDVPRIMYDLCKLSVNGAETVEQLVASGALPASVGALAPHQPPLVIQKAAALLYNLLSQEQYVEAAFALGAGAALVRILQHGPLCAKRNAAAAVYALATDADCTNRLVSLGAVHVLVGVLVTGPADALQNASAALYRMAYTPGLAWAIASAGAPTALIAVLNGAVEEAKQHAAAALFALSADVDIAASIIDGGGVEALVRILSNPTPPVAEAAGETLCYLLREPNLAARVVDRGVVPALVALLRSGSETEKRLATTAMASLAASEEGAAVVAAGGVPLLIQALLHGAAAMQEHAAAALCNLACTFGPRRNFVDAGALPALMHAMANGTDVSRENATAALRHITLETDLGVAAADAGALPHVIRALTCGVAAVEEEAAGVLYNLACESFRLGPRLIAAGALGALGALLAAPRHMDATKDLAAGAVLSLAAAPALRPTVFDSGLLPLVAAVASRRPRGRALAHIEVLCAEEHARRHFLVSAGRDFSALTYEVESLRAENAALRRAHVDAAQAVGEPSAVHDVRFDLADGTRIGASRLLLCAGSEYYRAALGERPAPDCGEESGDCTRAARAGDAAGSGGSGGGFSMREAACGVIAADPEFSADAYRALLRQLHARGFDALPESPGLLLELHRLARKLSPGPAPALEPAAGDVAPAPGGGDIVSQLAERCEAAMTAAVDVDNCIDLLLHARAVPGAERLADFAAAYVRTHLARVTATPRWRSFCAAHPAEALELMTSTAVALDEEIRQGTKRKRGRISRPW
mmetsp:Transcript_624/g.1739  ORF Transcript_624/g.1739 Transcript_624/m.1739 type:complete len:801 (-) Transcript_624:254-2656(-)